MRRKYAKYHGMKIREHPNLEEHITEKLYEDMSPEQISGRIRRREKRLPRVSKNAIYGYLRSIYGRRVEAYRARKKKRRRGSRKDIPSLKDRRFIDVRPKYIQERKRIGDAEADFIVSGKGGTGILLTLTDRKSRTVFIERIIVITIAEVHMAFKRIKKRFPELRTITLDNDILFQKHKDLARILKVTICFCHPYHSWEKGSIENTNGLVRRYIPKGSDISRYSKRLIHTIEEKLNNRPRKCLKYDTPQEVLQRYQARNKRN